MLVIRHSNGEIWWMEVSTWLHQAEQEGNKKVRQIPFRGERFTVEALHRWRDKLIDGRFFGNYP